MSFDLAASLRRLKPQKRTSAPVRRADADLPFVEAGAAAGPELLLDTSVYIDALQDRLPDAVKELLRVRQINHSSVAAAELAQLFGRLDPAHPETGTTLASVKAVLEAVPPHRLTGPSLQAAIEAGILTGVFARLRGLAKTDRQPLFNDAMLFLQALENGLCLLSRNIGDLDLIQQLVPTGRMLFYRQAA